MTVPYRRQNRHPEGSGPSAPNRPFCTVKTRKPPLTAKPEPDLFAKPMSKTLFYNLILTIVAIVVFIFIGASVYDAFTRNPVNRSAADGAGANTVSGQIEGATPDATQPATPTAADGTTQDAAQGTEDKKQADAAFDQTNDPTRSNAAPAASGSQANTGQASADSSSDTGSSSGSSTTSGSASSTTPTPGNVSGTTQSGRSTTESGSSSSTSGRSAPATTQQQDNSGSTGSAPSDNSFTPGVANGSAPPATRSNPDLRAVIPPVPTAPPRAEGVPPPSRSDQDMYNATDSGSGNGDISDSFPAPVSDFPAPASSGDANTGNQNSNQNSNQSDPSSAFPSPSNQGGNSEEQRRLEELRRQKAQLQRDLGF